MTCAWLLHRRHDIHLFEASDYPGGHTHTQDITLDGTHVPVDTGFIVFNDRTYPNFSQLLNRLGVRSRNTTMSFSVSCQRSGLEYAGNDLNGLFAQRSNAFSPAFFRMLKDILRFNSHASTSVETSNGDITLGEFLRQHGYSREFRENYVIPMAAAIWSAEHEQTQAMPARFFVGFFENHGLLSLSGRPQWKFIEGGSRSYVDKLLAPFRGQLRLSTPVTALQRFDTHVDVREASGKAERFDAAIVATHSDQALALLQDPSREEREILSAIPYQKNEAVLHTDTAVLPRRRRAWAAWNYLRPARNQRRVAVTYNMSLLQQLPSQETVCVTLNSTESIREDLIVNRMTYHHPVFNFESLAAQQRWREINGGRRTWYCGAYWGYGFHEDGVNSAMRVAEDIDQVGA